MKPRKELENILEYVPGKSVEEFIRETGFKGKVHKLASNENLLTVNKNIIKDLNKELNSINYYPDADCWELKKELARLYKVETENIFIGSGSDEVLQVIARAYLEKGRNSVIGKPSFSRYLIEIVLTGADPIEIELDRNFNYRLDKMLESVNKKTSVIFLANPNNPTGTYINKKKLDRFINRVPEYILVVLDEAYFEIAKKSAEVYPDGMEYIYEGRKNVVVLRSFSKIYGLAGLRAGYLIGDKKIVNILNKVRPPFNVTSLSQIGALSALKNRKRILKNLDLIIEQRDLLIRELNKFDCRILSSATNFVMVKFNGRKGREIYSELLKYGVIIRPLEGYELYDWVRITSGTKQANKKLISSLRKIL